MSSVLKRDNFSVSERVSPKTVWIQNDVKTSLELLEFSILIWKSLRWLKVNTWVIYIEMMKILYRRAAFEIWNLSKKEHRYFNFLVWSDRIIENSFRDNFLCYIEDEWVNLDENRELISSIYEQVRDFIKNHL